MAYKKITFCPYYEECKDGDTCHRVLGDKLGQCAKQLHLLISVLSDKPDCFQNKGDNK